MSSLRLKIMCLLTALTTVICYAINTRVRHNPNPSVIFQPFCRVAWEADTLAKEPFPTERQRMLADLVLNILPGMRQSEVSCLLGETISHFEMRRYATADLVGQQVGVPAARAGNGYYYDEYEWDAIYYIGPAPSSTSQVYADEEYQHLVLRFSVSGVVSTWYVTHGDNWPLLIRSNSETWITPRKGQTKGSGLVDKFERTSRTREP